MPRMIAPKVRQRTPSVLGQSGTRLLPTAAHKDGSGNWCYTDYRPRVLTHRGSRMQASRAFREMTEYNLQSLREGNGPIGGAA
jgi:hypothetical protein